MIRIAICEDQDNDFKILENHLNKFSKDNNVPLTITRFLNADSFLFDYKKEFDIIFMDIIMPGRNGMDCARKLREIDSDTILIFTTTVSRLAAQGYEVEALDYIIKPIEYPSFCIKFQRALRKLPHKNGKFILIKTNDGVISILSSSIKYIEVINHTLIYHTINKDYETYGSLKKALEDINEVNFSKINSCYVVNMDYITKIDSHDVYLDKIILKLSHPKKAEFTKLFYNYIQGNKR